MRKFMKISISALFIVSKIFFTSDILYARDIDITIRHIDRTYSQGTVDIYRVKSMDELKSVSIDTNIGKYSIPELGTTHSNSSQDIHFWYNDMENPDLIIKKVTGIKNGKQIDLTKYVKKEKFVPMKVIIRK